MCDIADTVEDGVAHDSEVAVILLTETPRNPRLVDTSCRHTTPASGTVGTIKDGVAPDTKVAVIRLTENSHSACRRLADEMSRRTARMAAELARRARKIKALILDGASAQESKEES